MGQRRTYGSLAARGARMKVAVASAPNSHWRAYAGAISAGIAANGDTVLRFHGPVAPPGVDAVVVWGWRKGERHRLLGYNVLVMERAYIDRFKWVSLGWNGLNGRATFPTAPTGRESSHFNQLMKEHLRPWRSAFRGSYALIMGQVQGDVACRNVYLPRWYKQCAETLEAHGWPVRFRPHPQAPLRVGGPRRTTGTLEQDLIGAAFVVTWNSNSAVDAVLAGVPAVTMDEGSMAWEVTSHSLTEPISMPDRTGWAARLAWKQWLPEELANGSAWAALKDCMPCN